MSALEREVVAQLHPDGAAILREVYDYVGRFVAYPSHHAKLAHVVWIAHAHLMRAWDTTPRIAFLSTEPGSGKSRALEVTESLVPNPLLAVSATPAYLIRRIADEDALPTVLFDEVDTIWGSKAPGNEELRALLNSGYRRGASAGRCVAKGKEIVAEDFPTYCPVALAGLGSLPDTILTRSVIIRMRRRSPDEAVEPYRQRVNRPEGERIRDRMSRWARTIEDEITFPALPDGIADRDADVWEPLIAVADAVGDEWPDLVRAAAVALVAESKEGGGVSLGVRLLHDLRSVFRDAEALSTETILGRLHDIDDAPWGDLKGKSLDSRGLSWRLKQYGVKPRTVRIGYATPKGYRREDMHDAWARYLAPG
ncbi:MAG TPA: DUF3631 domain-containing protein [Luteimonas sp.]|nr:DUF3631 domain-containing protein [Luteimonas sp.]